MDRKPSRGAIVGTNLPFVSSPSLDKPQWMKLYLFASLLRLRNRIGRHETRLCEILKYLNALPAAGSQLQDGGDIGLRPAPASTIS